ncbi:Protein kinase domain [Carpediemonas membranifera]|uniref:Protein kinase domain n=1 Tax=Carpediemonas membranifera TaxID=201153 RepID=A0A8J6B9Y2_9EUKA|nr:Protein kinase domain [Carpediemonas membranifera]|eukprot:KAG9395807.1 Protein kinase domain [Carpediemonas membranifera]
MVGLIGRDSVFHCTSIALVLLSLLIAACCSVVEYDMDKQIGITPKVVDSSMFGDTVFIYGEYAAISSRPSLSNERFTHGHVYVYKYFLESWILLNKLVVPSETEDVKPSTLALNDEILVAGSDKVFLYMNSGNMYDYKTSFALESCTNHTAVVCGAEVVVSCRQSDILTVGVFHIDPNLHYGFEEYAGISITAPVVAMTADSDNGHLALATGTMDWTVYVYLWDDGSKQFNHLQEFTTKNASLAMSFGGIAMNNHTLAITESRTTGNIQSELYLYHFNSGTETWELKVHTEPGLPEILTFFEGGLNVTIAPPYITICGGYVSIIYEFDLDAGTLTYLDYLGYLPSIPIAAAMNENAMIHVSARAVDEDDVTVVFSVERFGNRWKTTGFMSSVDSKYSEFGSLNVMEGNTLAVAAAGNAQDRVFGSAFTFTLDPDGSFVTDQRIDPMASMANDAFSTRIALSGDYMAVSAPGSDGHLGSIYWFKRDQAGMFQPQKAYDNSTKLQPTVDVNVAQDFGINALTLKVDSNGDGVLVAATTTNRVYLYKFTAGVLDSTPSIIEASTYARITYFGMTIDIQDDIMVVGTTGNAFEIVQLDQDLHKAKAWEVSGDQSALDLASFGYFVAISEDHTILISHADGPTDGMCTIGSIYRYNEASDEWHCDQNITIPESADPECDGSRALAQVTIQDDWIAIGCSSNRMGNGVVWRFVLDSKTGLYHQAKNFMLTVEDATIRLFSMTDEYFVVSTVNPASAFFYLPKEAPGLSNLVIALVVIVVVMAVIIALFVVVALCTLNIFGCTTAGVAAVVLLKKLRHAIIKQRLRRFAKAELTKLGVDSSNKLYSAIYDFFIAPEAITETEVIAAGGFGSVSRAVYKDQVVCIKKLHEAFQADATSMNEFAREAKSLVELSHPNVLKFLGATVRLPAIYIVTEFCALGSLTQYVDRKRQQGRLSVTDLLDLVIEAADGLAFIHSRGIVHRDIKPDNFFVSVEEKVRKNRIRVKVGDLGLAVNNTTKTMTNIGTMGFAAPELLQRGEYDQKADVFSFAMTIYALFSEELPFASEKSSFAAMKKINDGVRPEPMKVMLKLPELQEIVSQMWSQRPEDRPTMKAAVGMLRGLRKAMGSMTVNKMNRI